ncbi:MAG TPA: helix-turn-helix transcriptional regulator [Gemmatimonadaceae bacterium]|jgi:transcriptional regulator with XRE-family HTH domain|nr:helix-turn-helix transcriptional regulator [Gemmatimonadaceae bacterium]
MAVSVTVDQLGAELKRRREELGVSLRAVENDTKISAATLSRLERGSGNPDLAVVERLARWLNVIVRAAGSDHTEIKTDEDLKRTIAVHLRANKKLSDHVVRAIADSFDIVMRMEIERDKKQKRTPG